MCYYTDGTPCDSRCVHYPFFFLPHVGPINLSFHSLETAYTHHSAFTPIARPKAISSTADSDLPKPSSIVEPVPTSILLDPTPVDDAALLELICPAENPYSLFLDPVDVLESPIFKGKVFK